MTVGYMLKNMSMKELCHWIVYHRLEADEDADKVKKQNNPTSETQSQKDAALLGRLLELSSRKHD